MAEGGKAEKAAAFHVEYAMDMVVILSALTVAGALIVAVYIGWKLVKLSKTED